MLKALIFDFDGLILDTETPEYNALNEAYLSYGHKLALTTFGLAVGSQYNHEFEPVQHLQALTGQSLDAESFWKNIHRRRLEIIEQTPVLPGVENLIREGKARGLKLAVASSSPHAWVDGHLKRHDLFRYFDVIKCKEDVLKIKPAPDLFLAALKDLRVRADEALIFEDSLNGVIAACRAGIRVVAIPNPVTEHMNFTGEFLRLRSLAEVSLDDLDRKLSARSLA
jgi:HAD superfamily hydrolase (TIGR01509 family)